MGNNRTPSFARVASILRPAAPIRRPRAAAGLLISALLALAITSGRSDESGIVIYTTLDQGRDETAIAVPFVKAERFPLLANVTSEHKVVGSEESLPSPGRDPVMATLNLGELGMESAAEGEMAMASGQRLSIWAASLLAVLSLLFVSAAFWKRNAVARLRSLLLQSSSVCLIAAIVVAAIGLAINPQWGPGPDKPLDRQPFDAESGGTSLTDTSQNPGNGIEFTPGLTPMMSQLYTAIAEPLSRFQENRHWTTFLESEARVVHFVDDAPEWDHIAPEVIRALRTEELTPELLAFHKGIDFCQNIQSANESTAADLWKDWLGHLGINGLDEFERRDLINSEKAALEKILSSLPKLTPYLIVTDQVYKLGEFDFNESAFHLGHSYSASQDGSGDYDLITPSVTTISDDLFVSERNARELRSQGAAFICIQEVISVQWGRTPKHFNEESKRTLMGLGSGLFVSPNEWELNGNALRRRGESGQKDGVEFRESFSKILDEYHSNYANNVTPFYTYFSAIGKFKIDDADTIIKGVLEMQKMRDRYAVGMKRSQQEKRLGEQLKLISPPEDFQKLVWSYTGAAGSGFAFVGSDSPQASLEILPSFLSNHLNVYSLHEKILKELGLPGEQE